MSASPDKTPMREELIDSRQLLRALIELNIARKNMLSYPEGHHQVSASAHARIASSDSRGSLRLTRVTSCPSASSQAASAPPAFTSVRNLISDATRR